MNFSTIAWFTKLNFFFLFLWLLHFPCSKSCEPNRNTILWRDFFFQESTESGSGENDTVDESLPTENSTGVTEEALYSDEDVTEPEELNEEISTLFACNYPLKYSYMKSLYEILEKKIKDINKTDGICIQGLRAYSFFRNDHIMCFDHEVINSTENLTAVHLMLPINERNISQPEERYLISVTPKSSPLDNSTSISDFLFQKEFNLTTHRKKFSSLHYEFIDVTRILNYWTNTTPWACLTVSATPIHQNFRSSEGNNLFFNADESLSLPAIQRSEVSSSLSNIPFNNFIINETLFSKTVFHNPQQQENDLWNKLSRQNGFLKEEVQNNLFVKNSFPVDSAIPAQQMNTSQFFHLKHRYGHGPHLILFVGLTPKQIESLQTMDDDEEINDILLWINNLNMQNVNVSSPYFNRP